MVIESGKVDPQKKKYQLCGADESKVCDGCTRESPKNALEVERQAASDNHSAINGIEHIEMKRLVSRPLVRRSSRCNSLTSSSPAGDAAFEEKQQDVPSSFIPEGYVADDGSMLDLSIKSDTSERSRSFTISAPISIHSSKPRKSKYSDNARSSRSTEKGYVMRKLSQLMHRSMSSNSITSIMRPSRYSSNSTLYMNNDGIVGIERTMSCMNLNSFQGSIKKKLSRASSALWIARGVRFSKNMEVYVFCS